MSRDPCKSEWLERNLESTRRRVNQLEIDACRIRTELARLEVVNATGIVDNRIAPDFEQPIASAVEEPSLDWQPAAELVPGGMEILIGAPPHADAPIAMENLEQPVPEPASVGESWVSGLVNRSRGMYRRLTSPVMASLFAHGAILIAAVSITVATIEHDDAELDTTILVLGDNGAKESETFEPHQLADLGETGVQNVVAELPRLEAFGPVDHDPIPIDFEAFISPASPGKMGLSNAHDTELGKLPSGIGGLGKDGKGTGQGLGGGEPGGTSKSSRNGGRMDSTLFFGTEAKGNRFVFVVDNSSSMKGGRLEMAVAELVRTVEGLSPRQSFYVIFVSDQTYPMFYPQRGTQSGAGDTGQQEAVSRVGAQSGIGVGQESRADQGNGSGGVAAAAGRVFALGRRSALQRDGETRCADASHAAESLELHRPHAWHGPYVAQ